MNTCSTSDSHPLTQGRTRLGRWAAWIATITALLLVFAAYRQLEMMVQMAQQLRSCF